MSRHPAKRNGGVFPLFLWRSPPLKMKSAKIVPATAAQSWLFPKISANPLFTLAEKRRFYRSKLPALRADVDGLAQKSAKPFLLLRRLRLLPPPQAACRRFPSVPAVPVKLLHTGAVSGFQASGGYALGCARKAAQTADTGATARNALPVTSASPAWEHPAPAKSPDRADLTAYAPAAYSRLPSFHAAPLSPPHSGSR